MGDEAPLIVLIAAGLTAASLVIALALIGPQQRH